MVGAGDRLRRAGLRAVFLTALVLSASGCRYKILSGGAPDREALASAAREVSRARELPFLRPVKVGLAGPAELRRAAAREAGRLRFSGQVQREAKLMALLGLAPLGFDPGGALESILSTQPAGWYLPRVERLDILARDYFQSEVVELIGLFLRRDLTHGEIVAHELTHALQHQHFGLEPPAEAEMDGDRRLAHAALVEGDATLVGFELGLPGLLATPEGFLDFVRKRAPDMGEGIPAYLQERFKFPYLDGSAFVLALKEQGGFAAVNRAHRHPPRSTEEVLHPEKYLRGDDPPLRLDLSGLEPRGFWLFHQDTLGEFGARQLLARADPGSAARRASGWGGDRAAVFERRADGALLLVWVSEWDTPADAADFIDGVEDVLLLRDQDRREHRLELWERRVVLVDGPEGFDLYPVAQRAWLVPAQPGRPRPALWAETAAQAAAVAEEAALAGMDPRQALEVDDRVIEPVRSGPAIRLGTDSAGLTLGAFLQVRGERGLSIQRLRARAEGTASELLDLALALELELNGEEPLLLDAAISFAPVSPNLLYLGHFRLGRFRVPFSRSVLTDPELLPLNERPRHAALAPVRGVGLAYDLDLLRHGFPLRLRLGAFDGLPEQEGFGSALAARLDFTPSYWLAREWQIRLGSAYLHDRDAPRGEDNGRHQGHGLALDLRLAWRGFHLEGEVLARDGPAGEGLRAAGWSLTGGFFPVPGFLELVGRYEECSAHDAPRVRQLTGGLNLFYLSDRFRMTYNHVRRREEAATETRHLLVFQLLL